MILVLWEQCFIKISLRSFRPCQCFLSLSLGPPHGGRGKQLPLPGLFNSQAHPLARDCCTAAQSGCAGGVSCSVDVVRNDISIAQQQDNHSFPGSLGFSDIPVITVILSFLSLIAFVVIIPPCLAFCLCLSQRMLGKEITGRHNNTHG